jgi:phosphatidate cytidylyltransferase
MFSTWSNFGQRTIVSSIVTLAVWLIIYLSFPLPSLFILLILATISGALIEFYRLAIAKGYQPLAVMSVGFSALYALSTYLAIQQPQFAQLPEAVLLISLAAISGYYLITGKEPLGNIAVTIFGMAYLALPLVYLLKVNYFFPVGAAQDGRCWLIYLLFVTKMTDTGAYFFGKQFGRHPLAPHVSPKKTVEGAFAGLVVSVAFSLLFWALANRYPHLWPMQISFWQSLGLGFAISLAAQFGDLVESLLKRDAAIKDSNSLPGLGGALDIVDSIIFTAPLLYLFLKINYAL